MNRNSFRAAINILQEASLGLVSVRMSKIAYHLDYFAFPLVIAFCLYFGRGKYGLLSTACLFTLGLMFWTLAEYFLHRFVLHGWPFFAKFHQAHHDDPHALIAAPTVFSLGIFAGIALLPATLLAGLWPALPWFAGFLSGYLAFGTIHHIVHQSESQHVVIRHFKKFHARHHHGTDGQNFGVLTSFWDRVFGTYEIPKRKGARDQHPALPQTIWSRWNRKSRSRAI